MYQRLKNKYEYEEEELNSEHNKEFKKMDIKKIIGGKDNILIYMFTILISRMGLIAGVNPFGMAMLVAISDMKIPLLIPFIITAVMSFISFGPIALLKIIIAGLIYSLLKSFIKDSNTKIGNSAKLIFSTVISETIALLITDMLMYDALIAVYACITTAVFYIIFSEALPVILEIKNKKIFSSESLMAAGIFLAIAISGIGNIAIFNISIRGIISILTVLLLGWKRGASVGAAAGIAISIVLGLMGVGTVATIAAYGFSGLLAGIFSKFGKWGAALRVYNRQHDTCFLC